MDYVIVDHARKSSWRDHPDLVSLRKKKGKDKLAALIAEVKEEMSGSCIRKPPEIKSEPETVVVIRKETNPEYYVKMYFKNEFKLILRR